MPSLVTIKAGATQKTTWNRLHESMCEFYPTTRMSYDDLDKCVRLTRGLDFLPGTTLERVIKQLVEKKLIKADINGIKIIKIIKHKSSS